MKALLIGDGNSRFVRDYINVLVSSGELDISVDLFTMTYAVKDPGAIRANRIFRPGPGSPFPGSKVILVFTRIISLLFLLIRHGKRYDLAHIHYASPDLLLVSWLFGRIKSGLVVTVFGSDFYGTSFLRRRFMGHLFHKASAVTFANGQTRRDFIAFYGIPESRTAICRFGLAPLDLIAKPGTADLQELRHSLGLPAGKVLICVGSNFNSNQQHRALISQLVQHEWPVKVKDEIHFIFPFTCGAEHHYRDQLLEELKQFPFSHSVFTHYLTERENADLRMVTDIMVQVQLTDQLSGAMQEHLCAGNCVITGTWLPYSVFEEAGVKFRKIGSIAEIVPELTRCIKSIEVEKMVAEGNYNRIQELSNWKNTITAWTNLYKRLTVPTA